ncbi:D-serine deaminase-like pyridoxal phosphate-dependent protein [Actinomadura pelletieri DSM 43383]|uniref:D-serine deaminase-like pyridoxal phosphate-dependent protein n=1 Tax=Actinomadura pelletieri DSM 43383 TaxID=1120940 RepID=A0A495QZC9_9ACTN|nr:alanine racemase [Actinomadura pelletieri]RKS79520.1 D-serine deaminase-like pyridoxal phosphate-dependent protein [Actinomadura pelletieri DSM 43383]
MTSLNIPGEQVDWRTKGIWQPGAPVSFEDFTAARHLLFDGPFTWPLMVARRSALRHNIAALASFCAAHDLVFAPHGKTSMAPTLFQEQLDAGAWGITAATANQVLAYRNFGVPRILLANELLDPTALRWLGGEIDRGMEFLLYADSAEGVATISAAAGERPFRVLVELGHRGGRTGCRTVEELISVARAVAAAPGTELAGVAGYEGGLPDVSTASAYLGGLRDATAELSKTGLLPRDVIVTAGGSAYFDQVAERLSGAWLPGHELTVILRSGAYVTHDDGIYTQKTPYTRIPGSLDAALEIWAQVTSVPEPGLAIVGMGKREAPYDAGLPVPLRLRRRDGTVHPASGLRVTDTNDHHAYVKVDGPPPRPGDLLCFGISHPCTAFDKWQVIPVVDDDETVTDLIRTYF